MKTWKHVLHPNYHHFHRMNSMRNEYSKIAVETRMQDLQQCLFNRIGLFDKHRSLRVTINLAFDEVPTSICQVLNRIQSIHIKKPHRCLARIRDYSSHSTSVRHTLWWKWILRGHESHTLLWQRTRAWVLFIAWKLSQLQRRPVCQSGPLTKKFLNWKTNSYHLYEEGRAIRCFIITGTFIYTVRIYLLCMKTQWDKVSKLHSNDRVRYVQLCWRNILVETFPILRTIHLATSSKSSTSQIICSIVTKTQNLSISLNSQIVGAKKLKKF